MVIFSTGARIATLFASSFVTLGVQIPFFPVLLAHRGLSDGEIAVVVAVPMVLRITTVSWLGALADRIGDRRRALALYAFLSLLGCLLLGPAEGFAAILAATAATALFGNGLTPVTDAIATSAARRGEAVYGRMRLWGSLAFVAANLVAGRLIGLFDGGVVYPLLLAGSLLQLLATAVAPREPVPPREARPRLGAGTAALLADRRLMTILAGSALVQASHAMLYGFSSLHWRAIGFSGGEVGLLWAVSVVGEVILFAEGERALRLFGARGLLLAGGIGAVVRWSVFPFVGDGGGAWVGLQLVHAASFAAIHLGTMHVIGAAVGNARAATAQGLFVTLTGLAMALATFASGPLYARFGGDGFLAMAVVAGLGFGVHAMAFARRGEAPAA